MADDGPVDACCTSGRECVFARALMARSAACSQAARRTVGEREVLECESPPARLNCGTLAALLHERARFALRLPGPERPLMHVQAMRLHCGGLAALHDELGVEAGAAPPDVHTLVQAAHARHGSLTELPWATLVPRLAAWQPRRRGAAR